MQGQTDSSSIARTRKGRRGRATRKRWGGRTRSARAPGTAAVRESRRTPLSSMIDCGHARQGACERASACGGDGSGGRTTTSAPSWAGLLRAGVLSSRVCGSVVARSSVQARAAVCRVSECPTWRRASDDDDDELTRSSRLQMRWAGLRRLTGCTCMLGRASRSHQLLPLPSSRSFSSSSLSSLSSAQRALPAASWAS